MMNNKNIPKVNIEYKTHDLGYKLMHESILSPNGVSFEVLNNIDYEIKSLERINTLWNEDEFNKVN